MFDTACVRVLMLWFSCFVGVQWYDKHIFVAAAAAAAEGK